MLLSSGTDGYAKLWSLDSFEQQRSAQIHEDHAIVTKDIRPGLFVTGGKDGGGPENACGLDASVRTWDLIANAPKWTDVGVEVIADNRLVVWTVKFVGDKLLAVTMKRGKPTLEIWDCMA
jgi:WD40 repeat protein